MIRIMARLQICRPAGAGKFGAAVPPRSLRPAGRGHRSAMSLPGCKESAPLPARSSRGEGEIGVALAINMALLRSLGNDQDNGAATNMPPRRGGEDWGCCSAPLFETRGAGTSRRDVPTVGLKTHVFSYAGAGVCSPFSRNFL